MSDGGSLAVAAAEVNLVQDTFGSDVSQTLDIGRRFDEGIKDDSSWVFGLQIG